MLTRNLISGISRKTGMTKSKTEELLNAFTAVVTEDVMSGQTVQLYGLGQLEIRDKAPRIKEILFRLKSNCVSKHL